MDVRCQRRTEVSRLDRGWRTMQAESKQHAGQRRADTSASSVLIRSWYPETHTSVPQDGAHTHTRLPPTTQHRARSLTRWAFLVTLPTTRTTTASV
eukprot:2838471-Rhodomonas_salina.1